MATSRRPLQLILRLNSRNILFNQTRSHLIKQNRGLSSSTVLYGKTPRVNAASKVDLTADKKNEGFMQRMESNLEANYPKAHKLYMLIKQGIKDYYVDTKTLYRVSSDIRKGKKTTDFSYYELDVYRQMPRDLLRVGPIVVLLNLPITDVIMPFLVFLFPRQLLSRHFWTAEQQSQFGERNLRTHLPHYPDALHCMEKHCGEVQDSGHRRIMEDIIYKLEQNNQPSIEEIIEVKPLFHDDQPFGREFLMSKNKELISHLMKGLGLSPFGSRMTKQALLLHHTDLALAKQGVGSLTLLQMRQACFLRGLNAAQCEDGQMLDYLDRWTQVSKHVDESTLSLLLHSPVLLALNHPANATLLKSK